MNNILPDRKQTYALQTKVAEEGCTRSFEQLYIPFFPFLHGFAFRIVRSTYLAEEIVSDVFLQVWKNRNKLNEVNNLRVFLYVAVRNKSLNYLYKSKKENVSWLEEFSNEPFAATDWDNPFHQLSSKELNLRLHHVVNLLPPRCKVIYKLVKEDGLKYTEAARILDLSVKTIENQMGIALRKIASALKET